jgi:DNA topoisomerase-1
VPQGKIDPVEEPCPVCGKPQIACVDPQCSTNAEPDLKVGECPVCKAQGAHGDLIAQKSPRTLKRFIRCTNYETCNTSYPLPQRGKLVATDKVCEACGAPKVIVTTNRGPWELCPNLNCPLREEREQAKAAGTGKKAAAGKGTAKSKTAKGGTKRTAAKGKVAGTVKAKRKTATKTGT